MIQLSLLAILFLFQPPLSVSEKCHPDDKQALLNIKQAFNNAYHFASWDPDTDCCDWYIVKCDRNSNRIIDLAVFSANLSGTIPDSVADLPFLQSLTFHKITNLTGTIPLALTRLTNLNSLTITWTRVSGPIPSYLGRIKSLTSLFLSHNSFSGSIPPSLAGLTNLFELALDRNKLTGTLPGALPRSLKHAHLSHNLLSGAIPRGWGDHSFDTVELQRNRIEGDASALFGKKKSVTRINLSRNRLQFDVSKVEFPHGLELLYLDHNMISGALPQGMADLDSLVYLNVSYNRLCGRIPTGGMLQKFDYTSYFHNMCLCGPPLPNCK